MAISPTDSSTTALTGGAANGRTTLNANFDQFIKMLTTQMKYQDPLSPMDSTEFTNQLVNFSQVEQQLATNDKLEALLSLQKTNRLQGALDYLGLEVEATTSYFSFDGTNPAKLAYGFDKAAGEVSIKIVNSSGATVATPAAETDAGRHEITWDGKDLSGQPVAPGTFIIQVTAKDATGEDIPTWTTFTAPVTGVDASEDETTVVVGDVPVDEDKILAAWKPAA